jgi:hypothetical protein
VEPGALNNVREEGLPSGSEELTHDTRRSRPQRGRGKQRAAIPTHPVWMDISPHQRGTAVVRVLAKNA